jgi:hypothetical protein
LRVSEYIRKTIAELDEGGASAIQFDLMIVPDGDNIKIAASLNEPSVSRVRFWVKRVPKK